MAGAIDSLIPNRRQVLWDAGLGMRPGRNGQRAFPGAVNGDVPGLPDFTTHERMAGEYRVMGIYPRGHLMEFVRPGLGSQVMPAAAVEHAAEGEEVLVAGWPHSPAAPQGRGRHGIRHHRGRDRRRPADPVAPGLPPEPPPTKQPRPAGPGRNLPLGQHHQRRRLRGARRPPSRPHARRPRLALRTGG